MLGESLAHGLIRVVDPGLVRENAVGEEALRQPSLDDLGLDLVRLALEVGKPLENVALGCDLVLGHLFAGDESWIREGDVHRDETREVRRALRPHEHADLLRRRMDVRGEHLVLVRLEARSADDLDVLADPGDEVDALVLETVDGVRAFLLDGVDDLLGEAEELVVLGDGLRLRADGDDRAVRVLDARDDAALRHLAAGTLGRGRKALFAQELCGLVEVTLGLHERALRVHHRSAGHVAELLDLRGGDLRHSAGTSSVTGCSEGVSSAVASSAAGAEGSSGWPFVGFAAISPAVTFCLPASMPLAIALMIRLHERMASSFPGMT